MATAPANKFLKVAMESDDTDTDNSALYYSAIENSSSQIYNDDSTLEADHDVSFEKTMEKTVQHAKTPALVKTPAVKRFANSPLLFSGRKHQMVKQLESSSTPNPNMSPDHTRGAENDINVVNKSKLTLDFNNADPEEVEHIEIINHKLELIKLEIPTKPNWRFTSPSNPANPAYIAPEIEKEQSPGEIQFQKTADRISIDYEDLSSVAPPLTGRPSMVIDDFASMKHLMFKVKTPAKQLMVVESESEPEITPEVVRPPNTLEQAFEKMAAEMANSSIDEMVSKESPVSKESQLPKRTSISTAYRKGFISKANSVPTPSQASQIPAVMKRATWASRKASIQLPGIPEAKPGLAKKWSPTVDLATAGASKIGSRRKSYLPMMASRQTESVSVNKRQSLYQPALKPTTAPIRKREPEQKPAMATLKIATVKVGRRSSFGKPVGKPNIRRSMLPSRASPKPARRSVMPPPSSSLAHNGFSNGFSSQKYTGAIPKQPLVKTASKSELMCKYCDKTFQIPKALDDHLLLKCPKIPPKDKKKLLSQGHAARELEYSRKAPGNRSTYQLNAMDSSEASCSSVASGSSMLPPRSAGIPKTNRSAHSGLVHTPNKQITCMACGIKFSSVVSYTIHMTSIHNSRQMSSEVEESEADEY